MRIRLFLASTSFAVLCLATNTRDTYRDSMYPVKRNKTMVHKADTSKVAAASVKTDTLETAVTAVPKDVMDTIYYDKQWRVISNKTFAAYYRYALYPADKTATKYFKTFYSGGKLQGEGTFVNLDKTDDTKSVFDGSITYYYPDGEVKEKLEYAGGKENGEHTVYYKNGNIKEHSTMSGGQRTGIYSSFTEDGKVCRLQEYADGKPASFYVVVDMDGNYSKYDIASGKPIFEQPSPSDMKTEYKNGVAWPYYNKNGLIVGVSNTIVENELGKVREVGLFLVNKSMINVELDPALIEIYYVKKDKRTDMEFMSADEYDKKTFKKKVKNKKKQLKQKAVVTIEHEDNVSSNLGASVFDAGTSNTLRAFQERMVKLTKLVEGNQMRYADRSHENLGYLERTTVHPGEVVSGYLYTDDKKVEDLFVKVVVNGMNYIYEWKTEKK